jgi:hypothetical protein
MPPDRLMMATPVYEGGAFDTISASVPTACAVPVPEPPGSSVTEREFWFSLQPHVNDDIPSEALNPSRIPIESSRTSVESPTFSNAAPGRVRELREDVRSRTKEPQEESTASSLVAQCKEELKILQSYSVNDTYLRYMLRADVLKPYCAALGELKPGFNVSFIGVVTSVKALKKPRQGNSGTSHQFSRR